MMLTGTSTPRAFVILFEKLGALIRIDHGELMVREEGRTNAAGVSYQFWTSTLIDSYRPPECRHGLSSP